MWNPGTGVDTKCPSMRPMCQIMFYNKLPTSATNHRWNLSPEVGWFHIGALTDVEPGHWIGHQGSGYGANVSNHVLLSVANFCHYLQVDMAPEVGRFHIGGLTGALTDVKPGHSGGPQVSGHDTNVSNYALQSIDNFCHHSQADPGSISWPVPHRCLTDVKPGHWGGHQVSGHGANVSNHVL